MFVPELSPREQVRILAELKLDLDDEINGTSAQELLDILHDRNDTVWQVRDEIDELLRERARRARPPVAEERQVAPAVGVAATITTPLPAVGWYVDPTRRFELRYWDGVRWTEHVCRGGQVFVDPLAGG